MLCSGLHGNGGRGRGRRGHPESRILSLSFHPSPHPPPGVSAWETEGTLKGLELGQAKFAGWRVERGGSMFVPWLRTRWGMAGREKALGPESKASSLSCVNTVPSVSALGGSRSEKRGWLWVLPHYSGM